MKMKRVWTSGICLILTLLLLLGSAGATAENAAETTFSIRNGVTWASTAEEVLQSEGATSEDDYQVKENGDYSSYVLQADEGENSPQLAYAFRNGQLYVAAIYYESQPVELYDTRLSELTAQYGEPTETDSVHANKLFEAIDMGSLDEGLSKISGWTLSDGTAIYLIVMYDEVYLFCFNETLLTD